MMRFFRDLSRYKARKRLYGNQAALIPILLGKEDVIKTDRSLDFKNSDGFTLTLEQLAEMDGRTDETPIYLAILGNIFDVTSARDLYGKGRPYHSLAGKDSTIAFATGCLEGDTGCESISSLDQLNDDHYAEIDRWAELYHSHDKYKFIGLVVENPVDTIFAHAEIEDKKEFPSNQDSQQQLSSSNDDADGDIKLDI